MQSPNGIPNIILPIRLSKQLIMADLDAAARGRLLKIAVSENFNRVIIINPQLNMSLVAFATSLGQVGIRVIIISNEITQNHQKHDDVRRKTAIKSLVHNLPNNLFWDSATSCLLDLTEEAREEKRLGSRKELIITNFSPISIIAGLSVLGTNYPITKQDRKILSSSLHQTIGPSIPLRALSKFILRSIECKDLSADRSKEFAELLEKS